MTQEQKDLASAALQDCTVHGDIISLPAGELDTEIFMIVKDALHAAGAKYNVEKKAFKANGDAETKLQNARHWLEVQEVVTYEAPALYNGPETVEAEAEDEPAHEKKQKQFIKEKRTLRYDFTATEIHDLALQLAGDNAKLSAVEDEKAQQASHYGALLKEIKARLNRLSILITNGFENRDIECEIYYNQPEPGKKTIVRLDTNKATVEKMEYYEYNLFTQPVEETEEL